MTELKMTVPEKAKAGVVIPITEYIAHHALGGMYEPSRTVLKLMASVNPMDQKAGHAMMIAVMDTQAAAARRYAARLARDRAGSSKYSPHQGKRECARRLR